MDKKHLIKFVLFFALLSPNIMIAQILPRPVSVVTGQGDFNLDVNTKIRVEDEGYFTNEVFALQEAIFSKIGRFLGQGSQSKNTILIKKSDFTDIPDNAYKLTVTPDQILLEAETSEGVNYGIQSIRQLLQKGTKIPATTIVDYPAYPWRGLMLDVSRHFYPLEYLKQQIRLLSYYKMNKLHIHLSDDEGWRLEIKSLPELTQKSAWRDMNRHDSAVIRRTNIDSRIKLDSRFLQEMDGRMRYGGFYTQDEIRDLVQYAAKHHVELIPEIDMPGHMMAAILAYPELCSTGKPSWGQVFSQPLCPAKEEVFTFVQTVLDEVMHLFPSEYIHIGADEVDKTTWQESEACQALMKENGMKHVNELQSWFVERVANYLKSKGKKVIVWDDVLDGPISSDLNVMYWRDWKANIPYESIESEHSTIFCPGTPLYLSRRDSALYDIYHLRSFQELTLKRKDLVKGAQANVWGEQIGNSDWANILIWPRLLALAELTWTPYERRNWDDFKRRIPDQREYLKSLGIDLAKESPFLTVVQTPDAKSKGVRFHFEHEKIDPQLYYTLDGSEPTLKSKPFTDNILVKGPSILSVGIIEDGKLLTPIFKRPVDYHKAVGKKVRYLQPWNKAYPAAYEQSLTNGLQGADYYKDVNWQGFTNDLEVVIDLEDMNNLKDISIRFMQIGAEEVFMPGSVEISFSNDGENFKTFKVIKNDVDPKKQGLVMKNFTANLKGAKGRYMKVLAKNVHENQFIFTDEIIIH